MSADSWKITLPCSRAEAEALAAATDLFPDLDEPPVLNTLEPDEHRPEEWLLEAYTEQEPDAATLAAVRALVADAPEPEVERVPEQDWVTLSQAGLEPIRAGRFFVHTAAHADAPAPAGTVPFLIDAGRAFGTGHHHTTAGCLELLDHLRRQGRRFRMVADVGTGTGLLAFAALRLWPRARALATDIDPVSVEVTVDNAALNHVALGGGRGQLVVAPADGVDHPLYAAFAPFDLVLANILAQPLIDLAADLAAITAPGGTAILAGLLDAQADAVIAAYRRRGFRLTGRHGNPQWPVLEMRRRPI
jgi:ribosomal protein L11 methyltransferase